MPLFTIFPPVPRTVWYPDDPDVECLAGERRDGALFLMARDGPSMRVRDVPLGPGLYGVEFQLALDRMTVSATKLVARVEVTAGSGAILLARHLISAGDLTASFGGMYLGVRCDVIVEQPVQDAEFRLILTGQSALQVGRIKLVPRPGLVWFPDELEADHARWQLNPDRSATSVAPATMRTPPVMLNPGDYRVGFKLKPPHGATSGLVAATQVLGSPQGGTGETVIASDSSLTVQAMLANLGVPDAKLRFRLAEARPAGLQVTTHVPGLTIQWFRLATAEEAVWHHYYNLGGNRSSLGEPVSGFEPLGKSLIGLGGSRRSFEAGRIYWTVEHGPCEVLGDIEKQHTARGGWLGELGFPTGRPVPSADQVTQHFEGGVLTASLQASG